MSLPYFAMYPSDFEAKTSHLTLEEDGAYNRLLRLMWMTPGCSLPDDPAWIARRMRCDLATFERVVAPLIDEFMKRRNGRIFSQRLSEEFEKVDETSRKRSQAGKKGGRPKAIDNATKEEKPGLTSAKAQLSDTRALPEPEPEPDKEGGGGGTREAENPTFREQLLDAIGVDRSGMTGRGGTRIGTQADMIEAARWLSDLGLSQAECIAEVRSIAKAKPDGPPSKFTYFTPAMARLASAKAAPSPAITPIRQTGVRNDRTSFDRGINALADDLSAGAARIDLSDRDPFAARRG